MNLLERLLTAELFAMMLVFARLGSAAMLMPGFGDAYVPARAKLLLALAITVVVAPVLAPGLPRLPPGPVEMFLLIGGEIAVGVFLGYLMRLMVATLETLGMIIAFQIGLSSAMIFNPMISEQGSLIGVMLVTLAVVIIFQTDTHHLMLRALIDSYSLFVPGQLPPVGDFSEMMTRMIARSFRIAMELGGPFLLLTTLLYFALGLLSRLMPQLQVFFVALPLQLGLGYLLLVLTLSAIMLSFIDGFTEVLSGYLRPQGN
jgi:flagellar biosynthetic protein FliR